VIVENPGEKAKGMNLRWSRAYLSGVTVAAFAACSIIATPALSAPVDAFPNLGDASNFGVLGLAGTETITNSNVTINGNEGVVANATIKNMAPSTVTGDVTVNSPSQFGGAGKVNGSINTNTSQMGTGGTVQTAINNAITQINSYTGFTNAGNVTTATTFNATGTLNEIQVGSINLNNANLTLNGTANQYFVVNVTGNMSLVGTASLNLTGGITPSNVIYYFSGANSSINTHVGDVLNGIILGPHTSMNLDGTFNGEIIGGANISLLSGAVVNQPPLTATPLPVALPLFATGVGFLGMMARRRRRAATVG